MSHEPKPRDSNKPTSPPLVNWMSRHGWKVLVALVAIELLFHAHAVSAQTTATAVGGRQVTVRVNVALTVPRVAFVRQIVPLTVVAQPDGTQEVSFNVVVTANCRWRMTVRPRFPYRRGSIPRMDVRGADSMWVRLDDHAEGVVVVPQHEPCTAEAFPVLLRLESRDQVTALGRVQFDVAPLPRD